jgi:hypothetical protein
MLNVMIYASSSVGEKQRAFWRAWRKAGEAKVWEKKVSR